MNVFDQFDAPVRSNPPPPSAPQPRVIEVEAPDGSIVEFPEGTPKEVMERAMRARFGGPQAAAPTKPKNFFDQVDDAAARKPNFFDQVDNAASARPNVFDQFDTPQKQNPFAQFVRPAPASTVAPRKDWMDTLREKVVGKPGERGAIGIFDQGVRGVAQGLATITGLPADFAGLLKSGYAWGLMKAGVPEGTANTVASIASPGSLVQPYVGGDALKGYLDSLNNVTADALGVTRPVAEPQGATERVVNRVGQEVGAASVPIAGAIAKGRAGVEAARGLPTVLRGFVESAAVNPAKFARQEIGTATAAGMGAAGVNEATRAAGYKEGSVGHAIGDFAGALTGAGALGVTRVVGRPAADIWSALRKKDNFANRNVAEAVVDRLVNNSQTIYRLTNEPVDTAALVEAITGGRRVSDTLPGFRESLADRTADPGIASLEYSRQSGPNGGMFQQQRAANTAAIDTAMDANAPQGSPAALRSELELERTRRLTDAGTHTANTQDAYDRGVQALGPAMTGEARGADLRAALEGASDRAREIVRQAWEPINRSGGRVSTAPLADEFDALDRRLSVAERRRFVPNEADIPRQLATEPRLGPDGQPLRDANGTVLMQEATQPINEVTGLRTALSDAAREARDVGRINEARIIDQHVDALDNYLGTAVPDDLRGQYEVARRATHDYNDRFTRPQSAIGQALDRQQGQYRQPNSAVAGKFVQDDQSRIADFQALMRETGNDQRVVTAVRDQILADVRDRGLLERPDRLAEYLNRYRTVLSDPRFNGVRDQLNNQAGLTRALHEARDNQASLARELGTPERAGTSQVGQYLRYGDERAEQAMQGVLSAKKPGEAIDELLRFVNEKPEAVEGARKAFWNVMQKRARSSGETTKTTDGRQPWMPNRLKAFLDDPANAAVAKRLYRDSPEHLGNIRKIADELQGVDLRTRARATNSSGTAQGMSSILTPETIQSRFYAYKRGQTSLGFMLTALGSVVARRAVRGAQAEAIEKLTDRALLDPDLAAQLLKEHNPANRAALARTARAYLGNEASTLMDIIDGDTEDDPVKKAILNDGR